MEQRENKSGKVSDRYQEEGHQIKYVKLQENKYLQCEKEKHIGLKDQRKHICLSAYFICS